MKTPPPRVVIVVPCRNERSTIEGTLRSILNQEPPTGDFECIVADGMSDDGTREVLSSLARCNARLRVIDNPGRIVSSGLNAAIRMAHGEIVVRMDSHAEYAPDYLRRCVEALDTSGADCVGGPWIARGEGRTGRAIAAAFQSRVAAGGAKSRDPVYEGEVDTVYLGCWKRATLVGLGLFDEELVRNQDDELNLRLIRRGGRVWQTPRIRSWYRPRSTLGALWRQYRQYGYWKVRVMQKHGRPGSLRQLVPPALVLAVIGMPLLGLALPAALSGWCAILIAYLVLIGYASLATARRSGWDLAPLLPAVFACIHVGYGLGFLRGMVDFGLVRRGPARSYTKLTREGNVP